MSRNQIHIWRVMLNVAGHDLERLRTTLAPDELARAERFRFPRDRNRYVAARGALRAILGRYLGAEPGQVQFAYNAHGKPFIKQPPSLHTPAISFNVSHSHELALCAVAWERAVGIDVEFVRPELAEGPIAERFFAPAEAASLRALPTKEQPLAFFCCWTRKEAFVKARGEGLSLPLDRFEVSLAPNQPSALLRVADAPDEAARWSLSTLTPEPGYIAALAVEGQGWHLSTWDWQYKSDQRGA